MVRKIIPKSKISQGHVEIILSFTLFIGALIFLFIFINPFVQTKEKVVVGGIKDKVINEMILDIGKLSVVVADSESCYNFNATEYNGKYLEVLESDRKYNVYFGEIFNNIAPNKSMGCPESNYTLGIYSIEKIIVKNKTQKLVDSYNSNYESLRDSLGIKNDFVFKFKNINGGEISELSVSKDIPAGVDVYANEFPVRVMDNNADIKELILNIRLW